MLSLKARTFLFSGVFTFDKQFFSFLRRIKETKRKQFSLENAGETVDGGVLIVEDGEVTAERAVALLTEPQPEKMQNEMEIQHY